MSYQIWDIETIPLENVNKNILNSFEEKRWSKENANKELDFGVSPFLSRIWCYCIKTPDGITFRDGTDFSSERELLINMWNEINKNLNNGMRIVTFNGKNFDYPYVVTRSLVNDVKFIHIENKPWTEKNHFDVRGFLSNGDKYNFGSQDNFATLLGIDTGENPGDGSQVSKWYKRKEFNLIKEHNIQDVLILEKIYLKIIRSL